MAKQIVIHREKYKDLPLRFQKKLEHDLQYVTSAGIPGLKKIYLFGSCARGEVRSTSDIDLLIRTESRITDRTLTSDIRWTLDDPIDGVRTDVVFTSEGMEGSSRIFKREVDRDKKLILEVTE